MGTDYDTEQAVDAAFLHSHPNCYFIGPFIRRVSFASQQCRVLDLVLALKDLKLLKAEMKAAVIGAGLAGVTAAGALRGLGCEVHLFEAHEPFARQCNARHRVVHPTIARWPMESLRHSTQFPFMDWFAGPCDEVIRYLRAQWNDHLRPASNDKMFVFCDETEINFLSADRQDNKVQLGAKGARFKDLRCDKSLYDIVIVTTGFGEELVTGSETASSYWEPDEISLDAAKLEKWRSGRDAVVVTGCGDGGLIDCLRVVHTKFRDGWLAIELAEMLQDKFKDLIVGAERHALRIAKSLKFTPREASPSSSTKQSKKAKEQEEQQRFFNDAAACDPYVSVLNEAYTEVIKKLPPEASKLLQESIEGVGTGAVVLISKEKFPFVPESAPIHKLMIKHAIDHGCVTYKQGRCVVEKGVAKLQPPAGMQQTQYPNAATIVRHGAPPRMIESITPDLVASLRVRQSVLADYIDLNKVRELPPPPERCPNRKAMQRNPRDPDRARFINSRYDMAKAFIAHIDKGLRISADDKGFVYERSRPDELEFHPITPPDSIFGIDTRPGEVVVDNFL